MEKTWLPNSQVASTRTFYNLTRLGRRVMTRKVRRRTSKKKLRLPTTRKTQRSKSTKLKTFRITS